MNETTPNTQPATPPTPSPAPPAQPAPGTQSPAPKTELTTPPPAAPSPQEAPKDGAPQAELALKLPEGFDANDPLLTNFTAIAKESGLKPEVAQKVADLYVQQKQTEVKQQQERWTNQAQEWITGAKVDKEYGGEKFNANLDVARKALTRFGSVQLGTLLDTTALGNHPEVIRFFYRVGQSLAEDSVAGSAGPGAAEAMNPQDAKLRALYPTMFKE